MKADMIVKKILFFLFDVKMRGQYRIKVRKLMRSAGKIGPLLNPPPQVAILNAELLKPLVKKSEASYLKLYGSISGKWDHRYIPEFVYYSTIEPCLNNKAFSKGYTDKNFYPLFLHDFDIPETILFNSEEVFYNKENKPITLAEAFNIMVHQESFIIKPSVDSGGGRGVSLWKRSGGDIISNEGVILTPEYLLSAYKKNFIIQVPVKQHDYYSQFNSSSVNTIRVLTYRSVKDESIKILHSILRVGFAGSVTDNQASGGFACGIDEDGCLSGRAVNKHGAVFHEVNGVTLQIGLKVMGYDKILNASKGVAARYLYSRLLGLDFCVDASGKVRLIEVNCINNEINFFQMLNGPLFGDVTDEVIEWCSRKERSFMIDFEI